MHLMVSFISDFDFRNMIRLAAEYYDTFRGRMPKIVSFYATSRTPASALLSLISGEMISACRKPFYLPISNVDGQDVDISRMMPRREA